ncbi:MAG: PAS domain S-box protein [Desulfatiglandales bacterium]
MAGITEKDDAAKALKASEGVSEERYRAFIEGINDGVYEVDIHGNFTYFNSALCRTFGYPREDIQWQNFRRFMDEPHARQALEMFKEIYDTGDPVSDLSWEIVDKEGRTRIIELSASLITNKQGEKVGFRGIARDVTEKVRSRVALQESEYQLQCLYEESRKSAQRYRTLLDFIPYPMVVFTLDGIVSYLNPAFTRVFGWTLSELQGKRIPYVPPALQQENQENIQRLLREKIIPRHETKRLTKDGRIIDIVMRGALFRGDGDELGGELVFLRDVTREKRMSRNNEALLRISTALPAYPDLEDLLDYVSAEIRRLLEVQGALVILLDEEKKEFFFLGVSHEDSSTRERAKKIRYPADKGVSGNVVRTGESIIVPDTSKDPNFYSVVDKQLGYPTRNMLDVPLRSGDRIIGVLCAINKKAGDFDQTDVELLNMISSTVALSIENARFSEELKAAYREVISLNRAKDRVINHLSHELKTPLSVLSASLNILSKRLSDLPEERWKPTIKRAQRNLQRLLEIQYQVEDIMRGADYKTYTLLSSMLDQCADELEALVAEEVGEGGVVERLRSRIEEVYRPKETALQEFRLARFVEDRLDHLASQFSHRNVYVERRLEEAPLVCLPGEVLRKVVDGLVKNAVENTPDGGKISVSVRGKGDGCELLVQDCGVGITEDNQRRIFEGFFSTQDTMDYSSKRPFDFNAGGKGADLLRMKIFSEQYHFKIEMTSSRCPQIPLDTDLCPGDVAECPACSEAADCMESGGTTFTIYFPPVPEKGCRMDEVLEGR